MVAELRHSTAAAEEAGLRDALRTAWRRGRRYRTQLVQRHGRTVPDGLFVEIDGAL